MFDWIEIHDPSFHTTQTNTRDKLLQAHIVMNASDEWKVSAMAEMRMIDDIL
jgi:hypothetical protein